MNITLTGVTKAGRPVLQAQSLDLRISLLQVTNGEARKEGRASHWFIGGEEGDIPESLIARPAMPSAPQNIPVIFILPAGLWVGELFLAPLFHSVASFHDFSFCQLPRHKKWNGAKKSGEDQNRVEMEWGGERAGSSQNIIVI